MSGNEVGAVGGMHVIVPVDELVCSDKIIGHQVLARSVRGPRSDL